MATVVAVGARAALAQNVTIQLPSFHAFGVDTTVLAPDSGPSPLARERQARYGRITAGGLTPQRAIGIERRDAMAAATAKVHDPQEADRQLLDAARARRAGASGGVGASTGG